MMNKKIIKYKDTIYNVTSPGEIIYDINIVGKKGNPLQILDQLDNLSVIGRKSRKKYLKNKYNLTELDYYIIVVLEGDESRLPVCSYINPKTKVKCNNPQKFRSLAPKRGNIFYDGCEDHIINVAAQIKRRECYKKGITGLQKADRRSKTWREKLRKHAIKQMQEGNSIFSPDDIRRSDIKKPTSNIKVSGYNKIFDELNIDRNNAAIEDLILIDKKMFLNKGNLNDTCYYYVVFFDESNIFKLGVTSNIDSRIKRGYHGLKYDKFSVLFKSTREVIAELEYKVKLEYKDYICFNNEGFSIEVKDEILNYIENLIKFYN